MRTHIARIKCPHYYLVYSKDKNLSSLKKGRRTNLMWEPYSKDFCPNSRVSQIITNVIFGTKNSDNPIARSFVLTIGLVG